MLLNELVFLIREKLQQKFNIITVNECDFWWTLALFLTFSLICGCLEYLRLPQCKVVLILHHWYSTSFFKHKKHFQPKTIVWKCLVYKLTVVVVLLWRPGSHNLFDTRLVSDIITALLSARLTALTYYEKEEYIQRNTFTNRW